MNTVQINSNITRVTLPYKDIYTTVYIINTDFGVLIFDAGSYDDDMKEYILPALNQLMTPPDCVKYIYISHNHADHAGGLSGILSYISNATIITQCTNLKDKYGEHRVCIVNDNDVLLNSLKVVSIPGHTIDSSGILDTRTNTLIAGDCLQLYGIYGSGKWACNICYPDDHIKTIQKLQTMDIDLILTAHNYHPYGYKYEGKEMIAKALNACLEPLSIIKKLINDNQNLNDEQIADLFNSELKLPTLAPHVVGALRNICL